MKLLKKHIAIQLLLWSLLTALSTQAFSFSTANFFPLNSSEDHRFEKKQQQKAFYTPEQSISESSELSPELEREVLQNSQIYSESEFMYGIPQQILIKDQIPNKKDLLKLLIFPFHFFW